MQVMSCCFTVREWKGSASTDAVRSHSSNIGHWIGSVRRASGKEQDFFFKDIVVIGGIWGGEKLRSQRLLTRFEEQHSRFNNKIKGLMKIRVKWRIQVVM